MSGVEKCPGVQYCFIYKLLVYTVGKCDMKVIVYELFRSDNGIYL